MNCPKCPGQLAKAVLGEVPCDRCASCGHVHFELSYLGALFPERDVSILTLGHMLLTHPGSHLVSSGYLKSKEVGHPCDAAGRPAPWMNFAMIHLLRERLAGDMDLFEYGCGYSTLFFAERVKAVRAVEHDVEWFGKMRGLLPPGVDLRHIAIDDEAYPRAAADGAYDVIVVDGRHRVECVRHALPALKPGGVLLLDDSDREKYAPGRELLQGAGFRELPLEGLSPAGFETERTSVFYRADNCFGL